MPTSPSSGSTARISSSAGRSTCRRLPDGIAIIGPDESGQHLCQHYFDSRGVARVYRMSLEDGTWRLWRDGEDFSQRYSGTFSARGDRIEGRWEIARDGKTWETDFDLNYIKVS